MASRNVSSLTLEWKAQSSSSATSKATVSNPIWLDYITIDSYIWGQDPFKMDFDISLEGVDKEKIEVDFRPMSFDIKFHDVQGKNYRLSMTVDLPIVPEKCKLKVKRKKVIIILIKATGNWMDLLMRYLMIPCMADIHVIKDGQRSRNY